MFKLFFYISFMFLLFSDMALSQNAKETIEKRRIEKYIELGSGSFYINDEVGIGTTPSYPLHVRKDQNATTQARIQNNNTGSSAVAQLNLESDGGNATISKYSVASSESDRLIITNDTGGVYLASGATGWAALSDWRFKENWVEIQNANNIIKNWRCGVYNLIDQSDDNKKTGLVAQDVLATFPVAVDMQNPNKLGIKYTEVIPLIIKAIQEQQTIIATQKVKIDLMKNWICKQPDYQTALCGGE